MWDERLTTVEASRVLRSDGTFLFAVWDDYKTMNDSPLAIAAGVAGDMLGQEPLSLLSPPYHDDETIRLDLSAAGFSAVHFERISQPSLAPSARDAAVITRQGSMIRAAIEAADPARLGEVTDAVEQALLARYGSGPVEGTSNAVIVTAKSAQHASLSDPRGLTNTS